MKHLFQNHDLQTERCGQFIDITDDVLAAVEKSEVQNGTVVVYSPHTTCAVVINEPESGFVDDFCELLDELAPQERYYRHDDLSIRTEGIEDDTAEHPNGHSHLRAALLSSTSQAIPVVEGRPMLGRWQKIFFCELDRARPRKVFIQVAGD
jgi:secondary thiamine-phosphate synthase enzyme